MRILNKIQFMKQPPGILFAHGEPWALDGWNIKDENCGDHDFFYRPLTWSEFDGNVSTGHMFDLLDSALKDGRSMAMEWDCTMRDGMHDDGAVFCVLEDADIDMLSSRILSCKGKVVIP